MARTKPCQSARGLSTQAASRAQRNGVAVSLIKVREHRQSAVIAEKSAVPSAEPIPAKLLNFIIFDRNNPAAATPFCQNPLFSPLLPADSAPP
jgi:hypothetical protein